MSIFIVSIRDIAYLKKKRLNKKDKYLNSIREKLSNN